MKKLPGGTHGLGSLFLSDVVTPLFPLDLFQDPHMVIPESVCSGTVHGRVLAIGSTLGAGSWPCEER
jgi:hypothetical protein